MSDVTELIEWLCDEAECAKMDGCAVAARGYREAADEIESLQSRNDALYLKLEGHKGLLKAAQSRNEELKAVVERYADEEWWPEQLRHHKYLRAMAQKALAAAVKGGNYV